MKAFVHSEGLKREFLTSSFEQNILERAVKQQTSKVLTVAMFLSHSDGEHPSSVLHLELIIC